MTTLTLYYCKVDDLFFSKVCFIIMEYHNLMFKEEKAQTLRKLKLQYNFIAHKHLAIYTIFFLSIDLHTVMT